MNYKNIYIVLSFLMLSSAMYGTSAVTYNFSGGRFGDDLISYCHAKWISFKYDIPLLYKPFRYSDQLVLHTSNRIYSKDEVAQFKRVVQLQNKNFAIDRDADFLYVVPYFPESYFELGNHDYPELFAVDWANKFFLAELRKVVKPCSFAMTPDIPEGYLSVAVHVRKGTGIDSPDISFIIPHKSPPDIYYIEQLQKIADMCADKLVYVYIFTDHDEPIELVRHYSNMVNRKNITFACRENGNRHDRNVVDDFFALTKFDCLIRSDSNYSLMASKFADYKIQISPHAITRNGREIIIGEVDIVCS